jgi:DNA-binding CsgD family transcriptional regulator
VEIMLAADDVPAARAAADELTSIATDIDAPYLHAIAACATGAVLLAEGDQPGALAHLRDACKSYQALEAPYEAARVRVLIARALDGGGDSEGATRELDGARWAFEKLGAQADLARLQELCSDPATPAMGLSPREIEVLSLLASGKSNREISVALVISEHTVARHVQNIFAKIGASSRTGAAAFAFEHNLVSPG